MQVYCCVYSPNAQFIMARKRLLAYYFAPSRKSPAGNVDPDGIQVRNGGGYVALPGGGLHHGETPCNGARREWMEETNCVVNSTGNQHWSQPPDYCVCFVLTGEDLTQVSGRCNLAFAEAEKAVAQIKDLRIKKWKDVQKEFPGAPADNELATTAVWHLFDDWEGKIQPLQGTNYGGWFYDALSHLRFVIFHNQRPALPN